MARGMTSSRLRMLSRIALSRSKLTNGGPLTPFIVSANELTFSKEAASEFFLVPIISVLVPTAFIHSAGQP